MPFGPNCGLRSLVLNDAKLSLTSDTSESCYYARVLDQHCELAIDVIADILSNSIFDEKEIVKEKRVVLEELSTMEETPEELIHELFWSDLFPEHPLGRSIIGTRESLEGIERRDITDYLDSNYTGEQLVIAAAGNLEHDSLVAMVRDNFASFKTSNHTPQCHSGPIAAYGFWF